MGLKGDQVPGSSEKQAAGGSPGGITEAELAKNRDLAWLRSNVFMNGMREL